MGIISLDYLRTVIYIYKGSYICNWIIFSYEAAFYLNVIHTNLEQANSVYYIRMP